MAIVLGAGLVSQPSFIFGELSATPREEYYTLGAILAIIGAIAGGLFPVLMAKCKEVPSCLYMAAGGAVSLIVGTVHRTVITTAEACWSLSLAFCCAISKPYIVMWVAGGIQRGRPRSGGLCQPKGAK